MLPDTSQFYRDLVETSQDLVWQCDADDRYVFLNAAWEEVLGYPIAEMLGRRLAEFQPPEARERCTTEFARLLTGGIVTGFETVCLAKSNREVRLVLNAKAIRAPNGSVIGARGTAYDITHRWNAEVALGESEQVFRTLFENASDGMAVADADTGLFLLSNAAFREMLGYDAAEVARLRVNDIHPERSLPRVLAHFARMAKGDHRLESEVPVVRKDGSVVHCDIGAVSIAFGGRRCAFGSFRDVTERGNAKEALETSEAKFRNIVNASPMGMHMYELRDGDRLVFTGGNPAADRILGVDHAQFVGKTLEQAFPGLVGTEVPTRYTDAAQRGTVWWTEQIAYDNGQVRGAFEVVAFQTEPGKMTALFNEITARKRMAEALAAEKERLSVTLRSIGDGVIATDTEGRVVVMNAVAERLTGWTQSEAAGRPLPSVFAIINQISRQACENPVTKALATGSVVELSNHTVLVCRDGTERIIADSGAPIRDASGHVVGVVLVFRDMTEKMKLIETSQKNQKLESLGILAGGIAHDFNNLLGAIFGYIDLARNACASPLAAEYLDSAIAAMNRTRALTQQLLTFAKGGAPILKVDSLVPFLQDAVVFALSGSNVSCAFDIEPGLWNCEYDRNQLGQVVDNLVINAKQAMPSGGTVRVSAANTPIGKDEHPHLPPGMYVRISVADSGVGIPRENLARIFDPFFTTKKEGSGLGLATSYSIMGRHGGCIDVESERGTGSTFFAYLPAVQEHAAPRTGPGGARHEGSGRILVMDDDANLRSALCRMLAFLGYDPIGVPDGQQAIESFMKAKADGRPFRAVIADLTVPGAMGGSETAKVLRATDASVPLFVATGYSDDAAVAHPQDFGFTDSLSKPFALEELSDLLERNLKKDP